MSQNVPSIELDVIVRDLEAGRAAPSNGNYLATNMREPQTQPPQAQASHTISRPQVQYSNRASNPLQDHPQQVLRDSRQPQSTATGSSIAEDANDVGTTPRGNRFPAARPRSSPRRDEPSFAVALHHKKLIKVIEIRAPSIGERFADLPASLLKLITKQSSEQERVPDVMAKPNGKYGLQVNIAEMQSLRLRKVQWKLAEHAAEIQFNGKEPKGWESDVDTYVPGPWEQDIQPIGGSRDYKNQEKWDILRRHSMALFSATFLLVPMIIMSFNNGLLACLLTAINFVFVFGAAMAWSLTEPKEVMSNTAAYAAVLAVFIGLAVESSSNI
ncbi:hypothetical protein PG997_014858 [Apiospora hydei]|uniref:DUF6594 domain-containing protein n=1 Tax=Apiospora hydei TaxID=1337664 RepID=A0ABR1UV05_9PEZI